LRHRLIERGGGALQLAEQPLRELLPLDEQVTQLVLVGAGHLAPQVGQVVVEEAAKDLGFVLGEGQLHGELPSVSRRRLRRTMPPRG